MRSLVRVTGPVLRRVAGRFGHQPLSPETPSSPASVIILGQTSATASVTTMSTRRLIIAALVTGLAILIAFTIQVTLAAH